MLYSACILVVTYLSDGSTLAHNNQLRRWLTCFYSSPPCAYGVSACEVMCMREDDESTHL